MQREGEFAPEFVCITNLSSVYRVGQDGDIQLDGQFILEDHCTFSNENGTHILLVQRLSQS